MAYRSLDQVLISEIMELDRHLRRPEPGEARVLYCPCGPGDLAR